MSKLANKIRGKGDSFAGKAVDDKKTDSRDTWKIFLRLCTYVLHYWYLFIPAIVMTLLSNQLALLGPKYSGEAIDVITMAEGVDFKAVQDEI